ncbi:MAG: hypothetical protein ACR2PL_27975 [Dehalococcoidia bacterium]
MIVRFLAGLLIGMTTGAVAVVLFAPPPQKPASSLIAPEIRSRLRPAT